MLENFQGTKGVVATAFGELVNELWLGKNKAVRPVAFKRGLSDSFPQFQGYDQQDLQELLAFLLGTI